MNPADGKRSYPDIVREILQPLESGGVLTDTRPGSVLRTLVEAFSRELVETYATIGELYQQGYVDSAQGPALDALLALFAVQRRRGAAPMGVAVFHRDPRLSGQIAVPEGTILLANNELTGKRLRYRTGQADILLSGRQQASIPIIADLDADHDAAAAVIDSNDLNGLQVSLETPFVGIARIEIPEETVLRDHDESDEELRRRAIAALSGRVGGSEGAIRSALLQIPGVRAVALRDSTVDANLVPGEAVVVIDGDLADPSLLAAVQEALDAVRAPGIRLRLDGMRERRLFFKLQVIPGDSALDAAAAHQLSQSVSDLIRQHLAALDIGAGLVWNRLLASILGLNGIADIDLAASEIGVIDPGGAAVLWSPVKNIDGELLTRLILDSGLGALQLTIGNRLPVLLRYQLELSGTAPAQRVSFEEALTSAFIAYLNAVAGQMQNRSVTYNDLLDALGAALPAHNEIDSLRVEIEIPHLSLHSQLTASGDALDLDDNHYPTAAGAAPEITWGMP